MPGRKGSAARRALRASSLAALFFLGVGGAIGQELTPRAYWPAPKGTKVLVLGYLYGTGDVFFDPSIPLYGVESKVNLAIAAYAQTLNLWGRTARVVVELPYQWSTTQGFIVDTPAKGRAFGLGDLRTTLAVNLLGAPTMAPADFMKLRESPRPILGASLKVVAPTGQYNSDRLLNVGANRWAVRAELGSVIPVTARWLVEIDAGVWFLTDDDAFIGGKKEQEPIYTSQFHLIRRFRPGFWASLDANYFTGGRQTIGGTRLSDLQQNSRLGATVVVPVKRRQAVKLNFASGIFTDFGTDFDQYGVSYQVVIP